MWWFGGPLVWSGWWIFPIMGFIFMMVMMFFCSRVSRQRGNFCRMDREDEIDSLRREVRELKEQIAQLKKSGG